MLKYLLLARIESGKHEFMKQLEKDGFIIAKSHTSRERIDENDNSHYFTNTSEIPESEKLFKAFHNGNEYFYTKEEIDKADVINIDPENVSNICNAYPDIAFRFLYIAAPNEQRLIAAMQNAEDKITAEEDFIQLCEEENAAFIEFEDTILKGEIPQNIKNMVLGHIINHSFDENSDIYKWSDGLHDSLRQHNRLMIILNELADNQNLERDENILGNVMMAINKNDNIIMQSIPLSIFAEYVVSETEGMARIMSAWLKLKDIHFKD